MQAQRHSVDDELRDSLIRSVARTRKRIRELEAAVLEGRKGAKRDLLFERRVLATLKRQL